MPRFEVEQQFARLIKPILNLDPLDADVEMACAHAVPDYKDAGYRDDAYRTDPDSGGALKLSIDVRNTDVFVDESVSFDVTANHACELQIFYVEADGNVEVIPQQMIGQPFLEAGIPRTIPDSSVGALVFDTPAHNETLLLNCKEHGLGKGRLSAKQARALVKRSHQPPSRGLAIMLHENNAREAKRKIHAATPDHPQTHQRPQCPRSLSLRRKWSRARRRRQHRRDSALADTEARGQDTIPGAAARPHNR
ncbi:DUF4384 domain-containing protein [Breoghania sp. L-A4]|uniref:DUF4384 domain-containing protein n=1 Tax=Breoghania sp. L-A4 TaxID=2304600 RepID=UPI000E35B0CD|nr:DUF4384 domain-containing protein [Breoghania sp. L-A4]AXS41575.1 hypothetical protein D1F64_18155 [Breoghania sp. L-A4]